MSQHVNLHLENHKQLKKKFLKKKKGPTPVNIWKTFVQLAPVFQLIPPHEWVMTCQVTRSTHVEQSRSSVAAAKQTDLPSTARLAAGLLHLNFTAAAHPLSDRPTNRPNRGDPLGSGCHRCNPTFKIKLPSAPVRQLRGRRRRKRTSPPSRDRPKLSG